MTFYVFIILYRLSSNVNRSTCMRRLWQKWSLKVIFVRVASTLRWRMCAKFQLASQQESSNTATRKAMPRHTRNLRTKRHTFASTSTRRTTRVSFPSPTPGQACASRLPLVCQRRCHATALATICLAYNLFFTQTLMKFFILSIVICR